MFTIKGLNHLVLYVGNVPRAQTFYCELLGFVVKERLGDAAVFLVANGSHNHHDLGLIYAGPRAVLLPRGPRIGLYHAAWEVETIEDLAEARTKLQEVGVLMGEADHGNSLSIYAHDPDNNEFEIFWMVPREEWDKRRFGVNPLHLEEEISKRKKQ